MWTDPAKLRPVDAVWLLLLSRMGEGTLAGGSLRYINVNSICYLIAVRSSPGGVGGLGEELVEDQGGGKYLVERGSFDSTKDDS